MNILELSFLSVALSMDAVAVAICLGLTMSKFSVKKAVIIGMYFGAFQAIMPLVGFLMGALFAERITAVDHWIAFGLLCFLGVKMIISSLKQEECPTEEASVKLSHMLPLAIATSIDALAAGVSLAFLRTNIIIAVLFIGMTTFGLSVLGVRLGGLFGAKYKSKAELAGGIALILLAIWMLI